VGVVSALALVVQAAAAAAAADCESRYSEFLARFASKERSSDRYTRFCSTLAYIDERNGANGAFTLSTNQFSDWTQEEFQAMLGGVAPDYESPEVRAIIAEASPQEEAAVTEVPPADSAVDWRAFMPPIKDQGMCPSCWAFAAVAVVDFGATSSHSEQQVMDCGWTGCRPGTPIVALGYLRFAGSDSERAYPYQGTSEKCTSKRGLASAHISHLQIIFGEAQLATAASQRVVAVCIHAEKFTDFGHYSSGVYDGTCGSGKDGHCVAVVGYAPGYWIIRNSWGTTWGMEGYAHFKRGVNLCNIGWGGSITARAAASQTQILV